MARAPRRSGIRQLAGRLYHFLRRTGYWYLSGTDFSSERTGARLPCRVFSHQTPLIRNLSNTDMWLQYNKITNIGIAIRSLDGLLIRPGQVFSFWRLVGMPARARGYLPGMVLCRGRVVPGTGGGLCQLSNLLYWIALHSPLTVTERWRHGYDVFPDADRRQPFGSGATCSYPALDLQFRNDTDNTFQLLLGMDGTHLSGTLAAASPALASYRVIERCHRFEQEPWGGYSRHNMILRQTIDPGSGEVKREEFITENHAIMMYSPLLSPPAPVDSRPEPRSLDGMGIMS